MKLKNLIALALVGATACAWAGNAYVGASGGDWFEDTNWSLGHVPTSEDDVTIGDVTVTATNSIAAKSLSLSGATMKGVARLGVTGNATMSGSATLTVCAGPATGADDFATGCAFIDVAGTLQLDGSSVLYLESDYLSGGSVKTTAGSFVLGSSATVNASERGYRWYGSTAPDAPGIGYSWTVGGSYGALGGGQTDSSYRYGYEKSPVHPGSPNGSYAGGQAGPGGLVRIHVAKLATIDGKIVADANASTTFGGASGGGIWLTAREFSFGAEAKLSARGGRSNSNYDSNGGGGRIAIGRDLSDAELSDLALTGGERTRWARHRVKNLAAFRTCCGNDTMTVDVSSIVVSGGSQTDRPGTFAFVDRAPGLILVVR